MNYKLQKNTTNSETVGRNSIQLMQVNVEFLLYVVSRVSAVIKSMLLLLLLL